MEEGERKRDLFAAEGHQSQVEQLVSAQLVEQRGPAVSAAVVRKAAAGSCDFLTLTLSELGGLELERVLRT